MTTIRTEKAVIRISEQNLRQILGEVNRIRQMAEDPQNSFSFTDEPMPDWDLDPEVMHYEKARRGIILIQDQASTEFKSINFEIDLGINNNNVEQTRYRAFEWKG